MVGPRGILATGKKSLNGLYSQVVINMKFNPREKKRLIIRVMRWCLRVCGWLLVVHRCRTVSRCFEQSSNRYIDRLKLSLSSISSCACLPTYLLTMFQAGLLIFQTTVVYKLNYWRSGVNPAEGATIYINLYQNSMKFSRHNFSKGQRLTHVDMFRSRRIRYIFTLNCYYFIIVVFRSVYTSVCCHTMIWLFYFSLYSFFIWTDVYHFRVCFFYI